MLNVRCHVGETSVKLYSYDVCEALTRGFYRFLIVSVLRTRHKNRNEFNLPGDETGFDSQESKLPTYWKTPFSKICLAMKYGQQTRFIVIDKQADSLYSLIADGQHRATSLSREKWKSPIGPEASLQAHCNLEHFNAVGTSSGMVKLESVLLLMRKMIATAVTPESALEPERILMTLTRVETRRPTHQIMETDASKQWDSSWCSEMNGLFTFKAKHRPLFSYLPD